MARGERRGAILVLVLWLLLILSLIGLSYSSSVRTGVNITGNRAAKIKARHYARAGIERTIAELLIREEPYYYSELSGFYNDEAHLANQPLGDGFFSLATGRRDDQGLILYGITDEASRLNINTVTSEGLLAFPEITQEMASSLLDWRDEDWEPGLDGAEDEYYTVLTDPYYCKNAKFQTVNELLLVRGWTDVEMFGEDENGNGVLDRNEDDGEQSMPLDNANGELDLGLAMFLTVYSRDKELNPNGEQRLDLNSATEEQLRQIEGMTEAQARSVVQWRNTRKFASPGDLFDVTEAPAQQQQQQTQRRQPQQQQQQQRQQPQQQKQQPQQQRGSQGGQSASGPSQQGQQQQQTQRAFNAEQIARIVDWVCVGIGDKTNRVNINTAPYEVLLALPEMTETLANEIVTQRQSNVGAFTSRGDLRNVNGMSDEVFRRLIDSVTVQSYQFRVRAEGIEGEVKTVIEAVVDIGEDTPRILYWHES